MNTSTFSVQDSLFDIPPTISPLRLIVGEAVEKHKKKLCLQLP
ncbi:MAG: hypothetical protein AAF849_01545 [Bacteroidota bacterium]